MKRLVVLAAVILAGAPGAMRAQNPVPTAPPTPSVVVPVARTPAQDAAAAAGKTVTNADIASAIKNSGLSDAQVRARLQAAGFDAKLADPFFASGVAGAPGVPGNASNAVDPSFVGALQALGIVAPDAVAESNDPTDGEASRKNVERAATPSGASGVFGKSLFTGSSTAFDPAIGGAVDASYRLGVGDQLQLVITGDMETAVGLEVRRDGTVVVPQVGQISVIGLTLDAARTLLNRRAARIFSVIDAGKAHVDLSVSKVRTNQVTVVGEVERPGSIQMSALGTVFKALAAAGGPTVRGTFRNVEVRRGGAVVARVDLYDYLLRGDASKDVRIEQGDIVFVGLSRRVVALQGAVRRPAIYELREGEGFSDLLEFAGGLLPTAVTDRLQVDRVLPPAQRRPGMERALIDIPFNANLSMLDSVRVYDNDIVSVFSVGELRRNKVHLVGEVFQPGLYEWLPGMTLAQLIDKAQGFAPWALTDRIKIERPVASTGRAEIISLDARDSAFKEFQVNEFDVVTVLDGRKAFPSGEVTITGAVYTPGNRTFYESETLGDLVDLANGFRPWALTEDVKLTRTEPSTGRQSLISFDMKNPASARFRLNAQDRVEVLDARVARIAGVVTISGAVMRPASRPFVEGQLLGDLIDVSGGFRPEAASVELAHYQQRELYSDTSAVVRTFVVLSNGKLENAADTVLLQRGDYISVRDKPGYRLAQRTVTLTGLFTYPGVYVLERDGERVAEVVKRAGGLLPSAFIGSARVQRQGRPVAIDLAKALRGDRSHNVVLANGDRIEIGPDLSVVYVSGSVERQSVVPFRRGWGSRDYVDAAGGFTREADRGNIVVEYPSGELHRVNARRFLPDGDVTIVAGSTVAVGQKPEEKPGGTAEFFTRTLQITTTFVSLFLAYVAARR